MVRRAGACLTVVAALLLVGACTSDRRTLTVITFNACGNVCVEGGDESSSFVASLAERKDAGVVLLQEVCRSQAEDVARRLEAHLHYASTFRGDADGANRCPGDDYGIAVVTTAAIERRFVLPLPNPGLGTTQIDERRIVCVEAGAVTSCSTHLVRAENDPTAHREQVQAFVHEARRLRPWPVVVGGDLNDRLSAFDDLDRRFVSGPADRGAVDRVFASRQAFRIVGDATHRCRCSDHPARVIRLAVSGTFT